MTDYPDLPGLVRDDLDRAMEQIAEALFVGTAEFLFGAGMSADSGVPMGKELSRQLLHKFFPKAGGSRPSEDEIDNLINTYPFEALIQAIELALHGRTKLTEQLKEIFDESKFTLNRAHTLFRQLCMWDGTPRINRIFTTNYDNLLALGFDGAQTITETNVRRMREVINNGKLAVIHLHGRIDEHEPYQITESDVLNEKHRILTNELRAALITADAFVFVGYSMNDPDFRRLYQLYRADIENRHLAGKRTYVVMPAASATEFRFGSVLWASRDAVWIPMSATAFFERLKSFLEGYAEDLVREEISTKYGLKTRAALDNLISSTADILNVESADAVQFLLEARPRAGA